MGNIKFRVASRFINHLIEGGALSTDDKACADAFERGLCLDYRINKYLRGHAEVARSRCAVTNLIDDCGELVVVTRDTDERAAYYNITDALLPYFINGDATALTDDEMDTLGVFEESLAEEYASWHYDHRITEGNFTSCEVLGLKAMCHKLIVVGVPH
jgi:hypothetical protein